MLIPLVWGRKIFYAKDSGPRGLICSVELDFWAVWVLHFAVKQFTWVWPSPFAQAAAEGQERFSVVCRPRWSPLRSWPS